MKAVEVNKEPVTVDELKYKIRVLTDAYYDIQKMRVANGNRVCAAFAGISGGEVVAKLSKDEQDKKNNDMLKNLVKEYNRITDIYVQTFEGRGRIDKALKVTDDLKLIKSSVDYNVVKLYKKMLDDEESCMDNISKLVKAHPLWDAFFKDIPGVGPTVAARCIAYLDVHKARHVSCFWSYVGVGTRVDEDGKWVAMSKKCLVDVEYTDKDGNMAIRKGTGYNPQLQGFFMSVFVSSALRAKKGKYNRVYYDYKNRYENRADLKGAPAGRIHLMASRQCVKAFLRDLWVVWREMEGYTLSLPWEVEYGGYAPHKFNEYHFRKANGENIEYVGE